MFGIDDPGIWTAYLLSAACLIFAAWYGITRRNEEDEENDGNDSNNPDKTSES
ncbi:MAG: hypothetical protein LBD21_01850 [Tannerellaceae bacterium]|jgi:hypothetical protein|nr:hypothetical protein [Tannerellaceae bacterium]